MSFYQHTDPQLWTGRIDGDEPDVLRWHQVIRCLDLAKDNLPVIGAHYQGIALLGFCCDEGVRRNKGRTGAVAGPRHLREASRNFPLPGPHLVLIDAGDVVCPNEDLESAQALLGEKVRQLRAANYLPIVLGGGHEVAYGNFCGINQLDNTQGYGVVNFDAHFDLRAVEKSGPNSGTGFWQMQDWCAEHNQPFHYMAIGIQPYANTNRLFELAGEIGAMHVLAENCLPGYYEHILKDLNTVIAHSDTLHLSIDLDVFAAAFAPGVSATSYNGIFPDLLFKKLVRHVILSGKVAAVDIAELNPKYDIDDRTARLGASIIFDIVQASDVNAEYPA
jgi:formiminoglutamase